MDEMPAVLKLVLFSILFIAIVVVVVTTRNIFVSNSPDVWSDCTETKLEKMYSAGSWIKTLDEAANALSMQVQGAKFVSGAIEPCGTGYVFKTEEARYFVCEDGTVLRYLRICKDENLYDKTKTSLKTMGTSNISSVVR